jgi:hypothetical protein
MKVIICGGRGYTLSASDRQTLTALHAQYAFSVVLSGGARGADAGGEAWAAAAGMPVQRLPADWKTYGRGAGLRRNHDLVAHCAAGSPGMVVAFPGGTGTRHCVRLAEQAGLRVLRVGWTGEPAIPHPDSGTRGIPAPEAAYGLGTMPH